MVCLTNLIAVRRFAVSLTIHREGPTRLAAQTKAFGTFLVPVHKRAIPQEFLIKTRFAVPDIFGKGQSLLPKPARTNCLSVRMVEGHQCHRVAQAHKQLLVGRKFVATSPNKRFAEGAAAIDGKFLVRIEVHGKNLFYFFAADRLQLDGNGVIVMRIHFGMSGAFRTHPYPGPEAAELRDTVRLQLVNEEAGVVAHLSAMSVEHGDTAFYAGCIAKLGEDPLREDADPEVLWAKVQRCKKPIGLVLMDQSMVAGPGNIYRAEILFKAGVHPEQPALTITRQQFDSIWQHTVLLLQRGFSTGSIITVDPEEALKLGKPWTRRYVYNQSSCGRCGSSIRTWDMATRTVYACETCQPLHDHGVAPLTPARQRALAAAVPSKVFQSHCAPDPDEDGEQAAKLSVARLKALLQQAGLSVSGRKGDLVSRLENYRRTVLAAPSAATAVEVAEVDMPAQEPAADGSTAIVAKPVAAANTPASVPAMETAGEAVIPGTQQLLNSPLPANLSNLKVAQLREHLRSRCLATEGAKAVLVARLQAFQDGSATASERTADGHVPGTPAMRPVAINGELLINPYPGKVKSLTNGNPEILQRRLQYKEAKRKAAAQSKQAVDGHSPAAQATAHDGQKAQLPVTGTQHLEMASAEDAAREKLQAGEGMNVEHVALHTPTSDAVNKAVTRQKRQRT